MKYINWSNRKVIIITNKIFILLRWLLYLINRENIINNSFVQHDKTGLILLTPPRLESYEVWACSTPKQANKTALIFGGLNLLTGSVNTIIMTTLKPNGIFRAFHVAANYTYMKKHDHCSLSVIANAYNGPYIHFLHRLPAVGAKSNYALNMARPCFTIHMCECGLHMYMIPTN